MQRFSAKPDPRSKGTDRGATMVEFAIVVILFFTLIGGAIDFGVIIFKYGILTYATSFGTREGAVKCDADETNEEYWKGKGKAADIMNNFGFPVDQLTLQFKENPLGQTIELSGEWTVKCFFCRIAGKEISLVVKRQAVNEAGCYHP